jgi:hypothetical protein
MPIPSSIDAVADCIAAARKLLNYPTTIRPAMIGQKKPGNILVLPPRDTYIVGDLHANGDNLRR